MYKKQQEQDASCQEVAKPMRVKSKFDLFMHFPWQSHVLVVLLHTQKTKFASLLVFLL